MIINDWNMHYVGSVIYMKVYFMVVLSYEPFLVQEISFETSKIKRKNDSYMLYVLRNDII